MVQIAWTLSADRRELSIYRIDPRNRRLALLHPLKRNKPMSDAEAQKYVDDNFPNEGAVRAAADTLGLLAKGRR
jgi:hypothetical protein